jgi:Flp pilus assembly protein TadG
MLASLRNWRRSGYGLLTSFRKKEDGAAAVEFALVALPFFGLIFAVIELAIFFFASRFLEDGLFNASRKVLTQRLDPAGICAAFKTEVNNQLSGWFSPSKLTLTVTPMSSFNGTGTAVDLSAGGCSFGGTGQTMLVRASYVYPFTGFRFISGSTLIGKDIGLSASTAFRVE